MILFKLSFKVLPSKRKDVISIFDSIVGPLSVRPGCIGVDLYSDINHGDGFILQEEWKSRAEMVKHIESDEFRKILALMDLANESPEILFHTVSSSEGFELVEEIRR